MSEPRVIWLNSFNPKLGYGTAFSQGAASSTHYIRADEHDRLKAQADALRDALHGLLAGMVRQANQEGHGPTGADMLAAEEALRGYRCEGGER